MGCSSDDSNNNNNNNNNAPTTSIPDAAFEQALIDLGLDDLLDGSVVTGNIENVTDLVVNDKGISSLVGLEDFSSLLNLRANDNDLTSLNLNQNEILKSIFLDRNMFTQINVSNLVDLEKLSMNGNQLSSINVANNFNLQELTVPNNAIQQIDVSNNAQLTVLNVIGNPLTCIRVNAEQLTNTPAQWQKDDEDTYALTCN